MRVLVVDDEPSMALAISFLLRSDGHEIVLAGDGRGALDLARQGRFDVAVVDRMLPGIPGEAVCRAVRGAMPVLMISARTTAADRAHCLAAGADEFLGKPFTADALRAAIASAITAAAGRPGVPQPRVASDDNPDQGRDGPGLPSGEQQGLSG